MVRQKVTPFLWFDTQAEEAAAFYVSLFPDSAITQVTPGPTGAALVVAFRLAGVEFYALNGGPHNKLTDAFSLSVVCHSQAELDDLWAKLTAGGTEVQCGWLRDRFGLSWQLVPDVFMGWMDGPDRAKAGRVLDALMGMVKPDIRALQAAADANEGGAR